jgi:hypothetical protein
LLEVEARALDDLEKRSQHGFVEQVAVGKASVWKCVLFGNLQG